MRIQRFNENIDFMSWVINRSDYDLSDIPNILADLKDEGCHVSIGDQLTETFRTDQEKEISDKFKDIATPDISTGGIPWNYPLKDIQFHKGHWLSIGDSRQGYDHKGKTSDYEELIKTTIERLGYIADMYIHVGEINDDIYYYSIFLKMEDVTEQVISTHLKSFINPPKNLRGILHSIRRR